MRNIDRETRTRFEDTFERINAGLKRNSRACSAAAMPISSWSARTS